MTMKALIIKLSSMGDLIHTLPALTDAKKAIPAIEFDWVAEPAFAEIPTWHPSVNRVIEAPIRQWKRNKWQAFRAGAIKQFKQSLRQTDYDLIIDAQSALKTAIISTQAAGPRAGMDKQSVREYGAQWFYQQRYFIDKNQHAINRTRQLFARALNYPEPESSPDFGINRNQLTEPPVTLPEKYIVCVHGTTWKTKHWQQTHWQTLINIITKNNLSVVLLFGNENEKKRSEQLAKNNKNVLVMPKLSLSECATVIANAKAAVCVDTGLGHLAAALNTPAVHLYGPTDPKKIGATGKRQLLYASTFACAPCYQKNCTFKNSVDGQPACLAAISPEIVWEQLQSVLELKC